MNTIELLGAEWEPKLPDSFTERSEILQAFTERHMQRVFGAAIGLTWAHPGRAARIPFTYAQCDYDPLQYGGRVWDYLLSKKCNERALIEAGSVAFNAISDSIILQREVEDRAAFSEAPPEAPQQNQPDPAAAG